MYLLGAAAESGASFRDVTAGVASIATVVAIVVGAYWALRRFRRTAESRPQLTLTVTGDWLVLADRPFVRAFVAVKNDGGRKWRLLEGLTTAEYSRLGYYALATSDDLESGATGRFVEWTNLGGPAASWPLLDPGDLNKKRQLVLRPDETWRTTVLCQPRRDAVAILLSAEMFVKTSRRKARSYVSTCIVTSTDEVNADGTTTGAAHAPEEKRAVATPAPPSEAAAALNPRAEAITSERS